MLFNPTDHLLNAMLEFVRVIKVQEQVIAGSMHHLTLEVINAGKNKIREPKTWVKPWMNFKGLHEFKHVDEKGPMRDVMSMVQEAKPRRKSLDNVNKFDEINSKRKNDVLKVSHSIRMRKKNASTSHSRRHSTGNFHLRDTAYEDVLSGYHDPSCSLAV